MSREPAKKRFNEVRPPGTDAIPAEVIPGEPINRRLVRAFERIADLLEISGSDSFRISTYRRVSRVIGELADDIRRLHEAGVVAEIKGIGKSTADKIEQFIHTGRIDLLVELEKKVPRGLPDLLAIPGMGPKKVALVHKELRVANLADLKDAIADGRLRALPGFGAQSVKRVAEGIAFLESSGDRIPRGRAQPIATQLAAFVEGLPGVSQVAIAGSMRRGEETIGDLDLLCVARDGGEVIEALTRHPSVTGVLAAGKTKGSVTVRLEGDRQLQVDLRVVPATSFGAALQYFTGSKEHNVRLRELAGRQGLKLNEWGLFREDAVIAGATEADVYAALGLALPPPEVRQDRDEFDAERDFSDLVSLSAIRGDLHMHTVASDGKRTIEEMATAARDRGYAYVCITDHSKSSVIANGLSIERMEEHIEAIREADRKMSDITILAGCECDILSDGSLDYPDEILAACDFVVASIHFAQTGGKATPTRRTIAALENPFVSLIGHPTGRLIQRRPPMEMDMGEIVSVAARTHTALEVNASWLRLDLKDRHVRQAIDGGVTIAISTDAHDVGQLDQMALGVATARRGYARTPDVLNTRPLADLRRWIATKRS